MSMLQYLYAIDSKIVLDHERVGELGFTTNLASCNSCMNDRHFW
jgi:hypothetical protein